MVTDRETELALLSLLLMGDVDKPWEKAIADGITAESFGQDDCREIWEICAHRKAKGYSLGITELKASIRNNRPEHATVATISDVIEQALTAPLWENCVGVVQDRLARRIAQDALSAATAANGPEVVQLLRQAADKASEALSVDSSVKNARQSTAEFNQAFLEAHKGSAKIPTGIDALDRRTGGVKRGAVWVFGGLPGRGKSVILFQIASHAIFEGRNVLVFSLELMAEEVVARVLIARGAASADAMQGQVKLTKGDLQKIKTHNNQLAEQDFHVCDKGGVTIDEIEAYATRIHERKPLDFIVLDYIQLCEVAFSKGQSREQQVAQVSRRLKAMAKKFRCGVLTASQLNDDGKMRESRAISQDADAVWTIKPKHKVRDRMGNETESPVLKIDKLRGGNPSPDYVELEMIGAKQKFVEPEFQ